MTTDAGSKLAETLADPLKGLDQLNEKFGFLDFHTRETVRSLQAQGDAQGALREATDAAAISLNEMAKPEGVLDRVTGWWSKRNAEVEKSIADALDRVGGSNPDQMYASAQALRANRLVDPRIADDGSVNAAEMLRHRGILAGASPLMLSPYAETLSNQQSLSAGDIMSRVSPDYQRHQEMIDQQASLSKALGNPDTVTKLGDAAGQAFDALDRLNVGLATFQTNAERLAQQSAFTVAGIQAETFAEKTVIEYQKSYAEALARTRDPLEAAVTAETKRAEAIARSNDAADKWVQQQQRQDALLGLKPAQRLAVERDQSIDDARTDGGLNGASGRGAVGVGVGGGFSGSLDRTLGFEGGLNPRDTNGTPSNMGINAAANPGVDVANLTPSGAGAIYKKNYWDAIGADSMSPQMARVAFDTAVMQGVGQAMKEITASGGDASKMMDLREGFEGSLLAKNPGKYGPYAKAWSDRDAGLRADIGGSSTSIASIASTGSQDRIVQANDSYTKRLGNLSNTIFASADDDLAKRTAAFNLQASSVGISADKLAILNERLKLNNDLTSQGLTPSAEQAARIEKLAAGYGTLAKMQTDFDANQKRATGDLDGVRGFSDDAIGSVAHAVAQHKSIGSALRGVGERFGNNLIDTGVHGLTSGLFGDKGKPGGGMFGDMIGGMLGGSGKMGSATITAGSVTVIGSSTLGGATGGSGGGGLLGWVGSLFGSPNGGGGIGHNAAGTDNWGGGPTWVGERGPEIVNLPRGAQVVPNNKAMGGGSPTFHIGGPTINVQGDVSEGNRAMIQQAVAQGQQQTVEHITRNLGQIQADAGQAAHG